MPSIWLLAILACPLAMGAMMLFMMRGKHRDDGSEERRDESTR